MTAKVKRISPSQDVTTYTGEAVREFLARKGTKRTRDHSFKCRVAHWPYCEHCGLVALKNDASRKAAKQKCVVYE